MYAIDYEGLGKAVRLRRVELGMTQEMLAEQCGLSSGYIGDIERADRAPSLQVVLTLSYALEVPPSWLLYDSLPEDLFGFLDTPLKLREPDYTLRNTLSNWYLADLPDESQLSDQPVTSEQLSKLQFRLLGEDLPLFSF